MTKREHRIKKKEWRKAKRRNNTLVNVNNIETPPTSPAPVDQIQPDPLRGDGRVLAGRKRSQRAKQQHRRIIQKLEEGLKAQKRKNANLRAQISRTERRDRNNNDTPRKRAEQIMRSDISKRIKKHLTKEC